MTSARCRRTTSGRRWIVSFNHDREPGRHLLLRPRRPARAGAVPPVSASRPGRAGADAPVTIPSRDGLDLHSYLTLPVGVEAEGPADGADGARRAVGARRLGVRRRGAAAGQPRIRGAAGQLPRLDRLRQGLPEGRDRRVRGQDARRSHRRRRTGPSSRATRTRDRVAIFGGSYGGYATLVGVTFTPDVFAAAIDYVGISDLVELHAHAARRSPARTWPTTGTCSSATPTTRSRWPTCWRARRSPRSTRSARRCW